VARLRGKYGVEFTGVGELSRQLARDGAVWRRVQGAAVRGMIENTEDLLGRAMRDAPVDEGTLRASGSAAVYAGGRAVSRAGAQAFRADSERAVSRGKLPELASRGVEIGHRVGERQLMEGGLSDAVVGEVGFDQPYALAQHERLDFNHPKGGKAKYLEDNLKLQAGRYQANLEHHLRGALK